jgi:hypothetical protein
MTLYVKREFLFQFPKDFKVIFQNKFDKIEGVYNVIPLNLLQINGKKIFIDA